MILDSDGMIIAKNIFIGDNPMDIIMTSFGLAMEDGSQSPSPFARFPPLYIAHRIDRIFIDYSVLFLFERMIMDEKTFERLTDMSFKTKIPFPYSDDMLEIGNIFRSLKASGRLVLKNFDEVLRASREQIIEATQNDLKDIYPWTRILEEAINQWTDTIDQFRPIYAGVEGNRGSYTAFEENALRYVGHTLASHRLAAHHILDSLKYWKKSQDPLDRRRCRELLKDYLAYINFNLTLSLECKAPIIDWKDMQPFYEKKFRTAVNKEQDNPEQKNVEFGRKVFDILFPYFFPKDSNALLRAIDDRRVDTLRQFVQDSVSKGEPFDDKASVRILKDILKQENKASLRRKITGWATLPLGFVPVLGTPLQKGAEELVNALWSDSSLKKHSWFYLINDLDMSEATSNKSCQ
jgi:hypothetical protein